jgi:hypothetical protein
MGWRANSRRPMRFTGLSDQQSRCADRFATPIQRRPDLPMSVRSHPGYAGDPDMPMRARLLGR